MGLSKTPYEMQREQQERAIRAQEDAQARQLAAQAWQSFANMDVGGAVPKPITLPIDWQHGADIGAKHAAGVEQQLLEGKQRLEQIAEQGAQRRAETAMEIALKAKYAPKKYPGGPGPVSKLAKELWDVHLSIPGDKEQAERKNQRKTAIIEQLKRYGSGGRAEVEKFQYAVEHPYGYEYGTGTTRGGKEAEAKIRLEAEQERAARRTQVEALKAISRESKDEFMLSEEERARKQAARKKLAEMGEDWDRSETSAPEVSLPRKMEAVPTIAPPANAPPRPSPQHVWLKDRGIWYEPPK